jgi:hypothetical protein
MRDYQPVDLARHCAHDATTLGIAAGIPAGPRAWHGLPFQLGRADGAGQALIGFGQGLRMEPLEIPLGAPARWVIAAHRLLESRLPEGDPVGRVCADYVFRLAGGETVAVPIRERLEISIVGYAWGQHPMLAWPDQRDALQPRESGPWEAVGYRQTEVGEGWPRELVLWPWRCPRPGAVVESLTIVPRGPRFCLGALTLGLLDESPFCREARRDVRIVLPREADARSATPLTVEVDRGVASYAHALPAQSHDEFLADPLKGFGQPQNPGASPAHVAIAASPSATVTVKQGDEVLGTVNWSEIVRQGTVDPSARLRVELIDKGRNWVHTTVLDDETGKPVPCRIHFRSVEGVPHQPHGYHDRVNSNMGTWHIDVGGDCRLGQITYAYIDGRCQGWLPRGRVAVDIARGFEYEPIRETVEILPGMRELTFRLKRIRNMNAERWFSGDTHVHFLSTQGAHLEAAGEDLDVVNLLMSQWGSLFTDTQEWTGRPSVSPDGGTIVYASQENRQHLLGHLILLGLKDQVSPWCTDGPSESEIGGNLETTVARWADACRAQGGTVVVPHFPNPNCEGAALIASGRAHAVEMCEHSPYSIQEYYKYLNCGYKLPLTGGTDKMSSDVPVGLYRTYVHIPPDEPFTYDTWCARLRAGNTFISAGPLLTLAVEGRGIGDTIKLPGNGGTIEVHATAEGVLPFNRLEIVLNGQVVASTEEARAARRLEVKAKVKVDAHSWIAARCAGPGFSKTPHLDAWRRGIMAHTSPVYLAVGGDWWMFDADTANYLLTLMHGGVDYLRQRAKQWPEGSVTHHHTQPDHQAFLEEPFHQAIESIHARMHRMGIPH